MALRLVPLATAATKRRNQLGIDRFVRQTKWFECPLSSQQLPARNLQYRFRSTQNGDHDPLLRDSTSNALKNVKDDSTETFGSRLLERSKSAVGGLVNQTTDATKSMSEKALGSAKSFGQQLMEKSSESTTKVVARTKEATIGRVSKLGSQLQETSSRMVRKSVDTSTNAVKNRVNNAKGAVSHVVQNSTDRITSAVSNSIQSSRDRVSNTIKGVTDSIVHIPVFKKASETYERGKEQLGAIWGKAIKWVALWSLAAVGVYGLATSIPREISNFVKSQIKETNEEGDTAINKSQTKQP
jgi:hypothetical protein